MTMPTRAYSIVPGFFAQDGPDVDITEIGNILGAHPPRFGLLDDSPDHWNSLRRRLDELNGDAPGGTAYKILFLGRHGEGYHNVALTQYGREAWDNHYSRLNGDETMTWGPDPTLTPRGIAQAQDAHSAWLRELPDGIPIPEKCYSSPLRRALHTWDLTFHGYDVFDAEHRRVTIVEDLREAYGLHPCDMRSSRSAIEHDFPPPVYTFEADFREEDVLYLSSSDERETNEHVKSRAVAMLDRIFQDEAVYVSITAHSGLIRFGFLAALDRKPYRLPTGGEELCGGLPMSCGRHCILEMAC
ncbi:histidine phosphatase superfamily [Amylocystis lapponica]|nr:histidine phosphatase superfamily [Amylocystis lapponica]